MDFCLGWVTDCDIDASIIMMSADGQKVDEVCFSRQISADGAVTHSGDR